MTQGNSGRVVRMTLGLLIIGCLLASATLAASPAFEQQQKLQDGVRGDLFGFSIATNGRYLAVAAKAAGAGTVYVYERIRRAGDWKLTQTIAPQDVTVPAEFGESLAMSRDVLLVGARADSTDRGDTAGATYVYKLNKRTSQWESQQRLTAADGKNGDEFGRSVAVSGDGDLLAVGARFASFAKGSDAGAVYTYRFDKRSRQWIFEQKLQDGTSGQNGDQFGRAVALSHDGRLLAVGARWADTSVVIDVGAVFVYARDERAKQWTLSQTLHAEDGKTGDLFGQSVAIAADQLVVGARDADTSATADTGAAYVYARDHRTRQWTLRQRIAPEDGVPKGQFGFSLALAGHRLAIGARRTGLGALGNGAVYVYERRHPGGEWALAQRLEPEDAAPPLEFGQSLALSPFFGRRLAVGADGSPTTLGAVYSFH
jgi:hypothetical protein